MYKIKMGLKAEYEGDSIVIQHSDGRIMYVLDMEEIATNEESLRDYADDFRYISEALHELFDEKGDEIQRQIDFLKNRYNK